MGQTMKSNFKKSKGFTLIELIIVIIILGLLAVTVAPKLIDVSGDTRGAVMEGVAASIESANTLVNAKVLIAGVDTGNRASGAITIDGASITILNSYPTAATVNSLLDFDTSVSSNVATFIANGTSSTFTHVSATTPANCVITVTDATSAARPTVQLDKTGC